MGRNDSKFTISKYHMNKMEIIKLFQVISLCLQQLFLASQSSCFAKGGHFGSLVNLGGWGGDLFKETNRKNCGFCVEKERERKKRMAKRAQKSVTKKRESYFLILKSLNMNS